MTRECHVRFCEGLAVRFRRSTHPFLATTIVGIFFRLYLIMDIYSRKIVGWEIHENETADHAALLIRKACLAEGISMQDLVLHSDNGSPMKGATMLAMLQRLGGSSPNGVGRLS